MYNKEVPFLSLAQCAERSGISLHWWRLAVKRNFVPFFKSGVKVYVDYDAAMAKVREELVSENKSIN